MSPNQIIREQNIREFIDFNNHLDRKTVDKISKILNFGRHKVKDDLITGNSAKKNHAAWSINYVMKLAN